MLVPSFRYPYLVFIRFSSIEFTYVIKLDISYLIKNAYRALKELSRTWWNRALDTHTGNSRSVSTYREDDLIK